MLKNSKRSQQLRLLLQLQPPVESYRVRIGEYAAFWHETNDKWTTDVRPLLELPLYVSRVAMGVKKKKKEEE